jgi:adenosylcobinamide-GDP ribazoletransferase
MIEPQRALRARMAEAQLAVMLLTRLPVGRIADPVPTMAAASWAFPLAGLIVGAMTALVLSAAMRLGLPATIAAGLALAAAVIVTGGLHEDGLADTADGFGGGRDREQKLAIMRDSRIGSYGTLALILALGLRWSALAVLAQRELHHAAFAAVAIATASRAGLPVMLALLPPARGDGLGHAAARPSSGRAAVAAAVGLLVCAGLLGGPATLVVVSGLATIQLLGAWMALRQIGGQSGDVLGAMQQIGDLCAWLLLVALTS